jgi:KaiC/GvpD/RAD55 family RecA-like ATPase
LDLKDPYGLDPAFERVVLWYSASSQQFWGLVGHVLDPESLELPHGKLLLEACRQISKELGRGPGSALIVVQRLRRKVYEGKVTLEQAKAISALLDDAQDGPLPPMQSVVDELLPILKRRLQSQAILMSHAEFAKRGDFQSVRDLLDKQERLGRAEGVAGTRLGPSGFDVIERSRQMDRLPTGVLELDLKLNGGMPKRSLGVWIGDSGAGKSMALAHQACEGLRRQMFVGMVTLELPEHMQLARLFSNLTGVPVADILEVDHLREEAKRRVHMIESQIGLCEVAEFAPHATSVQELIEWVDTKEHEHGIKMQLLIVDYADKLHDPQHDDNTYLEMRYVYEGLRRDISMARDMWVWTASQSSRSTKESSKLLDMHHVADSMHKIRVGDTIVTLNPREDEQMEFFVAKNRLGTSRFLVGPIVTDFARARLVPVVRELGSW